MTIVFEDQKMIITHESGHVDTYTEADLQEQKDTVVSFKNFLDTVITTIDNLIAQIQASK